MWRREGERLGVLQPKTVVKQLSRLRSRLVEKKNETKKKQKTVPLSSLKELPDSILLHQPLAIITSLIAVGYASYNYVMRQLN